MSNANELKASMIAMDIMDDHSTHEVISDWCLWFYDLIINPHFASFSHKASSTLLYTFF